MRSQNHILKQIKKKLVSLLKLAFLFDIIGCFEIIMCLYLLHNTERIKIENGQIEPNRKNKKQVDPCERS